MEFKECKQIWMNKINILCKKIYIFYFKKYIYIVCKKNIYK